MGTYTVHVGHETMSNTLIMMKWIRMYPIWSFHMNEDVNNFIILVYNVGGQKSAN